MRELLTRSRGKLLGYLILATLLMKMVAPALSHTLVAQPSGQDSWQIAICTATGLKYIAASSVTADTPDSEGKLLLHASSTDHCLLCGSGAHDGLVAGSISGPTVNICARATGSRNDLLAFGQKLRWSSARPRAPPTM